jgi:hypothetical protein
MNDKVRIYFGTAVFLGLILFPVWYRSVSGKAAAHPEIVVKTKDVAGKNRCVMPVEYMRTSHMNLLKEWRETVVRTGDRNFISTDGREFRRSLTNTCLDCHSNKSTFCDSCHNYVAANPNCWECHVAPREERQ